jgi:hypothetical protein
LNQRVHWIQDTPGDGPFGKIGMAGMFTVLKVRDQLTTYDGVPGWYENPPGTVPGRVDLPDYWRSRAQEVAPGSSGGGDTGQPDGR